ncbi:UDP-N-acetylglucosamine--LPS N-acetylglucosamine transferase [Sneathiella sp. DP05]|uniref:UDP-N-acetylglucosamine--LPS N-acetylglucosamine transferase n=2 Tax=Sneathiella litorea TaxID=2606216 RepID=A0A6L8W5D1_9PROT|nr:UDP-N-acetylglucosamine--LPS N-acetylglucosamine transferase [Sneathiella litorea]MZR29702.1 UDP-N-acetylglucosamine--LPS N-acetylglucosamine transferase [Sneathiella litorea]
MPKKPKVLAISSAGGHWVQLQRLRAAWDGCDAIYITTKDGYREDLVADAERRGQTLPKFYRVVDANRWQKFRLLRQLFSILVILLRERPDVIVSTGAAAGFFALKIGKLMGARTIWVDSIANAGALSLSGQKAGGCADLWLTQWEHLAGSDEGKKGPEFKGSVV